MHKAYYMINIIDPNNTNKTYFNKFNSNIPQINKNSKLIISPKLNTAIRNNLFDIFTNRFDKEAVEVSTILLNNQKIRSTYLHQIKPNYK